MVGVKNAGNEGLLSHWHGNYDRNWCHQSRQYVGRVSNSK